MARFKDQRKGGTTYNVKVTDGKEGQVVGSFTVTALKVSEARREAIFEARRANVVIDDSRLFAHAPRKAA